ncbi:drebrin-like protein isoform X2 [Cephus cinctus]|nr:drebrin-like protein isoform X2 [Cephus cinctus]
MVEELNSGDIMYAFCRVIDTKTSLPKCLLLNWQGDGAPIVRKGTCANHIRDIERLLKGAHIMIDARSEEDIEVDLIMEKLARATASTYKFNEPRGENGGQLGPVGTTYRRVIPEQEINATERDQFWQREEIEERKRLEQERCRAEQERGNIEREIWLRGDKKNQLTEQQQLVSVKESIVEKEKEADQRAQEIKNLRYQQLLIHRGSSDSDEERKSRSEELRKQRSKETQQLIAQRTINARAIFEQNTAAGQMKHGSTNFLQQKTTLKTSPMENAKKVFEQNLQMDQLTIKDDKSEIRSEVNNADIEKFDEMSHIQVKSSEGACLTTPKVEAVASNQPETLGTTLQENQLINESNTENELYSQLDGASYLYFDPNNEGMRARALYDYQAADDTEITFDPGDIITHIDAIDEGWWQGLAPDGTYGLFPANYVEVINYQTT